jgi:DDE domain
MGAVAINRIGSVLMTRADPLEEPCAGQLACTVLQTSGGSDPFAEFNQDHRAVKRVTRPMLGFKSFWSAWCTIAGIEVMHAIRKGQLRRPGNAPQTPAGQFYALAA